MAESDLIGFNGAGRRLNKLHHLQSTEKAKNEIA
jgi:hypothetical protein